MHHRSEELGRMRPPAGVPGTTDSILFVDDDGRLFLYGGCKETQGIFGIELDRTDPTRSIGEAKKLIPFSPDVYSWERIGEFNCGAHRRPDGHREHPRTRQASRGAPGDAARVPAGRAVPERPRGGVLRLGQRTSTRFPHSSQKRVSAGLARRHRHRYMPERSWVE